MDFAAFSDHRGKQKKKERIDKYLDLDRELKKQWNMNVAAIQTVDGALWTVSKEPGKENGETGDQKKNQDHESWRPEKTCCSSVSSKKKKKKKLKLLWMQQNSRCRLCGDGDETITHIVSKRSKLAQREYNSRHDWVGKVIHKESCKKFKFGILRY